MVGKNTTLFKSYVESIILLYEIHCHLYMNKENVFINTVDYIEKQEKADTLSHLLHLFLALFLSAVSTLFHPQL